MEITFLFHFLATSIPVSFLFVIWLDRQIMINLSVFCNVSELLAFNKFDKVRCSTHNYLKSSKVVESVLSKISINNVLCREVITQIKISRLFPGTDFQNNPQISHKQWLCFCLNSCEVQGEEFLCEVVWQNLNGLSGCDDRGTVYHDHPRCWEQLSEQMRSAEAASPSSPDWQARPDLGDGYHGGQLGRRKAVVQAVFSQTHYSGQVDPCNCSSVKGGLKALIVWRCIEGLLWDGSLEWKNMPQTIWTFAIM